MARYLLARLPRILLLNEVASLKAVLLPVCRGILVVAALFSFNLSRLVDWTTCALQAISQLACVHWGCTLGLLPCSIQMGQTIRRVVWLSLVYVRVLYQHWLKLVLSTSLGIVCRIWVVCLLSTVDIHILWVHKSIWILRDLKDGLSRFWVRLVSCSSGLAWFLWGSTRLGCWVRSRLAYFESIFRNILHHGMTCNQLTIVLPFHLNLLKLFLELNLLLLLWRESLPIVTIARRLRCYLLAH